MIVDDLMDYVFHFDLCEEVILEVRFPALELKVCDLAFSYLGGG